MTNFTIGNKLHRTARLFLGMSDPAVARALLRFGYSEQAMQEGLLLLHKAGSLRLDGTVEPTSEPGLLARIEKFESTWFPVVRRVLGRKHPDVAAKLFLNLNQTKGAELAVTLGVFLARVAELNDPQGRFGPEGQLARALLSERGFTDTEVREAQAALDALTIARQPLGPPPDVEGRDAAVEAAWLWYLEWSAICRVAIKQRSVLRRLGFNRKQIEEVEETPELIPPPAPPQLTGGETTQAA